MRLMKNHAPWPDALEALLARIEYKSTFSFMLADIDRGQDSEGLTLIIRASTPDSYAPDRIRRTAHYFIVPAASYNEKAWRRWVFECILKVEQHEAMEFYKVDGVRPFAPRHGPGHNPYDFVERATTEEVRQVPT